MNKATISFPTREMAQAFAVSWSRYSLRGYALSKREKTGGASVSLDGVTPEDAAWINSTVQKLNEAVAFANTLKTEDYLNEGPR